MRPIPPRKIEICGKNEYKTLPNLYLASSFGDHERLQIALDNLSRLKLIEIEIKKHYADEEAYDDDLQDAEFVSDKAELEAVINESESISFEYGSIEISSFGIQFYKACSA